MPAATFRAEGPKRDGLVQTTNRDVGTHALGVAGGRQPVRDAGV